MVNLFDDKKGQVGISGTARTVITAFVSIIIIFALFAEFLPELFVQGNAVNATGITFGGFFAQGGLVFTLLAIALFLAVLGLVLPSKGGLGRR